MPRMTTKNHMAFGSADRNEWLSAGGGLMAGIDGCSEAFGLVRRQKAWLGP